MSLPSKEDGRQKSAGAGKKETESGESADIEAAASVAVGAKERFTLKLEDRRVILTVFPPSATAEPMTKDEILAVCRKRGYASIDSALVENLVTLADGVAGTIGEHEARPAGAIVMISHDGMNATMSLTPPEPGGRVLTLDELKATIRAEGVIYGLKDDVVEKMVREPKYQVGVVIAEGRPIVPGTDGWIDYQFELERKMHLKSNEESGKIDFKELDLIENVVEGQLLAVKKPLTAGTAGITVKNEYIPAKSGRDVALLVGKNVSLSPDGSEAFAAVNGMPLLLANKITVSQIFVVKGSVGPETGNINFLGSVQVTGSVEDGYTIKASDAISIANTVGKAALEAGGDITVRGGLIEGKCVCGGSLRVKFIQEGEVDARQDVIVSEAILHSKVESGGRIIVGIGGRKGTIIGGVIRAFTMVACRVLGSTMSTKTNVDVGINPKLLARMEELQSEIVKDRGNFENLKKGLTALATLQERLGGQLPPDKQKIYETLTVAQNSLKIRLMEQAGELKECQTQAAVKVQGVVSVSEEALPGVKITIGAATLYINKTEKFVTFKEEAREVRICTYEAPVMEKEPKKGRTSQAAAPHAAASEVKPS